MVEGWLVPSGQYGQHVVSHHEASLDHPKRVCQYRARSACHHGRGHMREIGMG